MNRSFLRPIAISFFVFSNVLYAGDMGAQSTNDAGVFLGLGGGYNTVTLNQNYTSAGSLSSRLIVPQSDIPPYLSAGPIGGRMYPFQATMATFAPQVQAGYYHGFPIENAWGVDFWGIKYGYQYLGISSRQNNVTKPLGSDVSDGSRTGFFGLDSGTMLTGSVQTGINHEMMLLAFVGHAFKPNTNLYLGAGPALFGTTSNIYDAFGDFKANITGLSKPGVIGDGNHFSSSNWVWGGAGQLGLVYAFSESWSLDLNYTYAATGNYKKSFRGTAELTENLADLKPSPDNFIDWKVSSIFNLLTDNRIVAQSINFTINKKFVL